MNDTDYKDWRPVIAKVTFLVLTVALVLTVVYMLRNVLHAIILGVLFAIMLMPLHERIVKKVRQFLDYAYGRSRKQCHYRQVRPAEYESRLCWRSRLYASIISIILVFFVIVVPLSAFGTSVVKQGITAIPKAAEWVQNDMPRKSMELYEKYRNKYLIRQLRSLTEKMVKAFGGDPARMLADMKKHVHDVVGQSEVPILDAAENQTPETAMTQSTAEMPAVDADSSSTDGAKTEAESAKTKDENTKGEETAPPELSSMVAEVTLVILHYLRNILKGMLSKIGFAIFNFFIMLFVMFHIFLDGKRIWEYLLKISPFSDSDQNRIVGSIKNVTGAIFYSIFGTALIQGGLSMIAFRIVGVPALFWGTLLGMCSIIPFVGTGLIWVPVTVYLFMAGHTAQGVFILLFCGCFVANVDSIIRPFLMKRGGKTGMSYMVLFFSILGGLQTFGLIGIIYGPIIVGLCSICLFIFSTQVKSKA
ncbi:MAG: AI-2E family transporter [Victivallales bacterium]|nr:AI-2E family transporter [Victivallales bacterium]